MKKINDFGNFSDLFSHCLDLKSQNKQKEAHDLFAAYIGEYLAQKSTDAMWGWDYVLEALEMRILFADDKIKDALAGLKLVNAVHHRIILHLCEMNAVLAEAYLEQDKDRASCFARASLQFASQLGRVPPRLISVTEKIQSASVEGNEVSEDQ